MTRYHLPRLAALGAGALVLETTALDAFAWGGARPELLLLLACFAAFFGRDESQALLGCWMLGLVKDVGSAGPPGWHALLFLVLGWTLIRLRQTFYHQHLVTQFLVPAACCASAGLVTAILVSATQGSLPAGVWFGRLLASSLLTGLVAPVLMQWLLRARFLGR